MWKGDWRFVQRPQATIPGALGTESPPSADPRWRNRCRAFAGCGSPNASYVASGPRTAEDSMHDHEPAVGHHGLPIPREVLRDRLTADDPTHDRSFGVANRRAPIDPQGSRPPRALITHGPIGRRRSSTAEHPPPDHRATKISTAEYPRLDHRAPNRRQPRRQNDKWRF